MIPIREVNQSSDTRLITQMPANINVFMHIALIQGELIAESMKKQDEAKQKSRAARLIDGIVNAIQKGNTTDVEKMKAQYEAIMKNLRTEDLNVHLEMAGIKVNAMLNGIIEMKKKFDEALKDVEKATKEYNSAVSDYNFLKKKLAEKEKEFKKWGWVPGYGPILAIEVLILKGKVNSAASKVNEKKEGVEEKAAIAAAYKKQMDEKQGMALTELTTLSGKLAGEASNEIANLQLVIDSALNSIDMITGGR